MNIKRSIAIGLTLFIALTLAVSTVLAGNPHFVGNISIVRDGNSLTISGKLAGLGNEDQVEIRVEAEAACINPGSKKPQAANKESFSAQGTFPVQNGKADFSLTLTATFQPNCSPPMSVVWTNIVVIDLTHGLTASFPGPF